MAADNSARIERLHVIGAAVTGLVIVLVGYFFLIAPQRTETDDVQSQIADAQLRNTTLQSRIAQLDGEQKKLRNYAQGLANARQALPSSSDMSSFLRQVQAVGTATSTVITSMTVGDATAVTPPAATVGQPGTGSSAAPAPAAAAGIFVVPITATVTGSQPALSAFLTRLQSTQPRAVLITKIDRASGDPRQTGGTSASTMQLAMGAFIAPDAAALAATAAASPTTSPGGR